MAGELKQFNPFTENTAGEYFVGRDSALHQFTLSLNGLAEGVPSHIYVAGVHGTGKTSFLQKLSEISVRKGFLGVVLSLDERHRGYDHVSKILRSMIASLDDRLHQAPGAKGSNGKLLLGDWERGKESSLFCHVKSEQLESDLISRDLFKITSLMRDSGIAGAVICIDEGQRITPDALSAIKNSLQGIGSYLIVISLRLVQDKGGAVSAGRVLLDEKGREAEGDFGASRFFISGIPMGPFESDTEAAECIHRRLEKNSISFDEEVVTVILKITDRIPREIISLSSQLYARAAQSGEEIVSMSVLNSTFASLHRADHRHAQALCASVPAFEKKILRCLLAFRKPATAEDIVRQFGDVPEATREAVLTGVKGALERLQKSIPLFQETEDGFEIKSPVYRYALELALEAKL